MYSTSFVHTCIHVNGRSMFWIHTCVHSTTTGTDGQTGADNRTDTGQPQTGPTDQDLPSTTYPTDPTHRTPNLIHAPNEARHGDPDGKPTIS